MCSTPTPQSSAAGFEWTECHDFLETSIVFFMVNLLVNSLKPGSGACVEVEMGRILHGLVDTTHLQRESAAKVGLGPQTSRHLSLPERGHWG